MAAVLTRNKSNGAFSGYHISKMRADDPVLNFYSKIADTMVVVVEVESISNETVYIRQRGGFNLSGPVETELAKASKSADQIKSLEAMADKVWKDEEAAPVVFSRVGR